MTQIIAAVTATILPVFLTLLLGMMCRKIQFIKTNEINAIRRIAVDLTLPMSTFAALSRAEFTGSSVLLTVWVFTCCCVMLIAGKICSRKFCMKSNLTPYLCTAFEGGMLGFPLFPLLKGSLTPFALVDIGQIIFIFTVYKVLLAKPKNGRAFVRELISSPSLWALALGTVVGASGLYAAISRAGWQDTFEKTFAFLAAPTAYLILLTVGYNLDFGKIKWQVTIKIVSLRLGICAVMMAATLLFNYFVLSGYADTTAIIMLFILPAPFVLSAFSKDPEEEGNISSALSVMTVTTLLIFCVLAVCV